MQKTSNIILNRAFLIIILLVIGVIPVKSQDAPMSQFYSNLVALNPAFTGTTQADRINFFYRNQWIRTPAGFHTFGLAYDKNFDKYSSGAGLVLSNEINGAYVLPSVDFTYSYMVEALPGLNISMALKGGIFQKYRLNSTLIFENPDEQISGGFSKITPDFGTGLVAFYNDLYGGVSVDHIAQPYQGVLKASNERLNRKYTVFIGYLFYYHSRLKAQQRILSPNLLAQFQGAQQNINWGFSFQYDNLIGGLWLRHSLKPNVDALIFSAGYKTKTYRFAYSYDMNVGKKTTVPLGAHEISITMLFETRIKKKFKSIKCPTFLL